MLLKQSKFQGDYSVSCILRMLCTSLDTVQCVCALLLDCSALPSGRLFNL